MDEKLPDGWVWTTLGIIGEYINGFAFNDELWSKKGRPIIRIQDLTGTRNTPNYYDGEIEEKYLVRTGDFLIAWSATLGAFIWKGPEAWLNQHIFKVDSYIDKLFHYYLAQSVISDLYQNAHGSGMVHVTRGIFEGTKVPLPPLPEQHRIVAAIEQQFTRLDNAVASLQSARARIKQYRASLLKTAVEGELTKEWRAEHPTEETGAQLLARILAERRARWEEEQLAKMREKGITPKDDRWKQRYEEPQGPDVEELPDLPEGWCWATVEQIAATEENSITDGPFGSNLKTEHYKASGVRVIRLQNIGDGFFRDEKAFISQDHFDKLRKHQIFAGDLVIAALGDSPPRSCIIPDFVGLAIVKADCIRYKVSPHILNTYVSIMLNAEPTRKRTSAMLHGIGRPRLNLSEIKSISIAVPPFAEQQYIMFEVEARLSNIAQMEETIEASLKRAEHERQSILREAFAGRLVPQNPEDEPASVLLMRIREERKKREEAEKIARSSKKGIQMEIARKRRTGKASLYTTLVDAARPLPPDDLFKGAGLKTDEQPESVEEFYEELDADVENALVAETRPVYGSVLLEALEPPAEEKARMEAARQAQETEQGEETMDKPTLWNG